MTLVLLGYDDAPDLTAAELARARAGLAVGGLREWTTVTVGLADGSVHDVPVLRVADLRGPDLRVALLTEWRGHLTHPGEAPEFSADVLVLGDVVPLPVPTLEGTRAAALAEVAVLEAERMGLPVTLPGLPPMGIGQEAQARWSSILLGAAGCVADGLDPDAPGALFPAPFSAADGSLVTLHTYAEARQIHRGLLMAGAARTIAADRARSAITQAVTVDEIAAALGQYRSAP